MNGSTSTPPPTSSTATSSDKLSGQLIIKAQLGDDVRKMMIHNEDLTLNELVLMMERIFAGKISNSDELTIKYLDDDGDKITLLNDSDLTVALHFHKLLRLFVLVNGSEQINNNSTENLTKEGSLIDAKTFRNELQQIRNSVQTILDRLQLPTSQNTTNTQEKDNSTTTTTATAPPSAVVSNTAREFDPYKNLQQTQRSTTPDSIQSRSSTSKKVVKNEQQSFQPTSSAPTFDGQSQYPPQSLESSDVQTPQPTVYQQTQMPTPHFVPAGVYGGDQQNKTTPFAPPQTSYAGMPPLPNAGAPQFPTSFPPQALPNANATSAYNPNSTPPLPPNAGQTSTFIGQQQQQQQQQQPPPAAQQPPTGLPPPPQQGGFYGQQQALLQQQRPGLPPFNPANNPNNAFGQQQVPPPSSSSPATINPSYIQSAQMPTPTPLATQPPYGGCPPQQNYYNPMQQYPKAT